MNGVRLPRPRRWALTNPIDRVKYEPLSPRRADFETIVNLMVQTGVLDRAIPSKISSTPASPKARMG